MLVISLLLLGVLLVVIQTTFCMPTPVWLPAPDFYFVLVGYLAYRLDLVRSLLILLPLGCILDVLSGTVLGMYSVICFSGFFLLRFASDKLPVRESLYQIPLLGLSYLIVSWGVYLLMQALGLSALIAWSSWKMLVRTFLVMAFSYPLFLLFDLVRRGARHHLVPWSRLRLRADNRRRSAK
jgi:rod shape-determining protein MreD